MSNLNDLNKKLTKPSSNKDLPPCNPNDVACPMPDSKEEKSESKDLYNNTGFGE